MKPRKYDPRIKERACIPHEFSSERGITATDILTWLSMCRKKTRKQLIAIRKTRSREGGAEEETEEADENAGEIGEAGTRLVLRLFVCRGEIRSIVNKSREV